MEETFPVLNGVTLKPGVRVLVTDRDHGNWDYEGTIVAVAGRVFDVAFQNASTFKLHLDQIEPTSPNTPEATAEAEAWNAARTLKVFLCHASEDKSVIGEVYDDLRRTNMKPWMDQRDIPPGEDWDTAIRNAVRACQVVLVFLSRTSIVKRGYLRREIRWALDCADEQPAPTPKIIPVRLDDSPIPRRLSKLQWIDLHKASGRDDLVSHLKSVALKHAAQVK